MRGATDRDVAPPPNFSFIQRPEPEIDLLEACMQEVGAFEVKNKLDQLLDLVV